MMSLDAVLAPLVLFAIMGSGVLTGLLFAFSNFVMQSLMALPAEAGQRIMQQINKRIVNPVFLLVFAGTAVLSVVIICVSLTIDKSPATFWLHAGSIAYLVGPCGITVAFNVPLNNSLEKASSDDATTCWPAFTKPWLAWNHARTIISAQATAFFSYGIYVL